VRRIALALTPRHKRDQSRAPSLRPGFPGPRRYYEPLGLPPDTVRFRRRLIPTAAPNVGCRGGPRLFRVRLSPCAPLRTPGTSCTPPACRCSLLPSPRHDRLGHPSLSGVSVTGLQGFTCVGPTALLPSQESYDSLTALDTPLRSRDLAPNPGSATRRAGAYRGGTLTRESNTARNLGPQDLCSFRTQHGTQSIGAASADGIRESRSGAPTGAAAALVRRDSAIPSRRRRRPWPRI
jgi:hypothetical protein